ncbi:alpha/beta fold hydrolase [Vulcanococcus limneticus]|uniref:alpha/beta fold hydrolase n=1 Tax=Vulcanococcus limneticus TaxID=2170428 RepID=UPI00398BD5B5
MTDSIYPLNWQRRWSWQGHSVAYIVGPQQDRVEPPGPSPVVLIHGFGACKEHWRHNVPPLLGERAVFAIDLLGFGESDKPRSRLEGEPEEAGSCRYCIDLWADQVVAFVDEVVQGPVQLVGNSIGGVVALAAARQLEQLGQSVGGVVLIDCAQRALDDKRLAEQPPLRRWGRPLLKSLVRQRWLTGGLFRQLSKASIIRKVLEQAYPTRQNIDDQLVQLLLQPAQQPGASEAFRGFINLFNDRIAPELLADLRTPVRMIWGQSDPWEPISEARRWSTFACVQELVELPRLGHCPHDEAPDQVNPHLLEALRQGDR